MNSYTNIVVFILSLAFYYLLAKPKLQVETLQDEAAYKAYSKSCNLMLLIVLTLNVIMQVCINCVYIVQKCGGSVSQNAGYIGLYTFAYWFFFMGIVVVCLLIFDDKWKKPFSNTLGYFFVSNSANDLLSNLLIDTSINDKLENISDGSSPAMGMATGSTNPAPLNIANMPPSQSQQQIDLMNPSSNSPVGQLGGAGPVNKKDMEDAASAIVKLVGNMSIVINSIVPINFITQWNLLKPLMKSMYQGDPESPELLSIKDKLLSLVVARDNVGEAMWFVYTGFFVISILQFQIAKYNCSKDVGEMQNAVDKLQKTQTDSKAPPVKYTVT